MNRATMFIAFLAAAAPALASDNIIVNGGFERDGKEGNLFEGWSANIMGYMPRVVGRDEKGQAIFHYICGCGADLGTKKPWAGLMCPQCGRISVAEETGSWYDNNASCVKIGPGRHGRGCMFEIPWVVGANQGVRLVSNLVPMKRDWPYEITVSSRTEGPTLLRVFVECYRVVDGDKDRSPGTYDFKEDDSKETDDASGNSDKPDDANAAASEDAPKPAEPQTKAITPPDVAGTVMKEVEKTFRSNLLIGSSSGWKSSSQIFMAPPRYKTDYLQVKLYAYMPTMDMNSKGKAYWDDVIVRPLTPAEAKQWLAKQKSKKDKRFN